MVLPSGPHMKPLTCPSLLQNDETSFVCRVDSKQSIKCSADCWLQGWHAEPPLCRIRQLSANLWLVQISRLSETGLALKQDMQVV